MTSRMANADAAWLHMDRPNNLMVINSVMLFDQPLELDQLKAVIAERLVERYPKFRQRVVESHLPLLPASWEDDPDFAIEHHVHHVALPAPGDDAALQALVSDLMTMALDRHRPLWHMYLVDGYGATSALIIRTHHCMADGIALARVLLSLTDGADNEDAQDDAGDGGHPFEPVRDLMHLATTPSQQVALAGALARDARSVVGYVFTPSDRSTAIKGEPGISRRVAWTQPLSLARIKQIAHGHDVTVNDVLLAAVSGALREYLREGPGPVAEVQAMIPFNLRPLDEPPPRELGNHFGLVFLSLPVATRTAHRRLVEVHRRMEAIKSSRQGPVSYALLSAAGLTPEPIERLIVDMFSGKATAVITNVPGPSERVFLAGTPVRASLVWAPTSGHVGMSVSIFSYRGQVTIGLMVDAVLVPDPMTIVDALEHEVDVLEALPHKGNHPRERRGVAH